MDGDIDARVEGIVFRLVNPDGWNNDAGLDQRYRAVLVEGAFFFIIATTNGEIDETVHKAVRCITIYGPGFGV